jgi:hypothetical protein
MRLGIIICTTYSDLILNTNDNLNSNQNIKNISILFIQVILMIDCIVS